MQYCTCTIAELYLPTSIINSTQNPSNLMLCHLTSLIACVGCRHEIIRGYFYGQGSFWLHSPISHLLSASYVCILLDNFAYPDPTSPQPRFQSVGSGDRTLITLSYISSDPHALNRIRATLRYDLRLLPETAKCNNVAKSVVSTSLTANVIFASAPMLVAKAASADQDGKTEPILDSQPSYTLLEDACTIDCFLSYGL